MISTHDDDAFNETNDSQVRFVKLLEVVKFHFSVVRGMSGSPGELSEELVT